MRIPREQALQELLEEARQSQVTIQSDEEAQSYLNWTASIQGALPENHHAVTLGNVIYIRPEYVENVRVLREELLHVHQQRKGISTNQIIEAEIETRLQMIQKRHVWGLTNDEVREMISEIRQIRKTERY